MAKEKKKTCFIIMPLTVPESLLDVYDNNPSHFVLVLENLFLPAVCNAGLEPIQPKAEGEENIEAKIVRSLEIADWVLCDMSTFNANVFFEFGVRTALNKPVCVVKDDKTGQSPFDTRSINCHMYLSNPQWEIVKEVNRLTIHIQKAIKTNDGTNSLWRYFGVSSSAVPVEAGDLGEQIQFMRDEIRTIRSEIRETFAGERSITKTSASLQTPVSHFLDVLRRIVAGRVFHLKHEPSGMVRLRIDGSYDFELAERIRHFARNSGVKGVLEMGDTDFAL